MRAVYYKFDNQTDFDEILISGDTAHHLNVVRVKGGESLLLMNGEGRTLKGRVTSVGKKEVYVKVENSETFSKGHKLSLAIAMPKKDAFEDILKIAVEIGIVSVYPLASEFSQHTYAPGDRVQRVLESALIQSNNPFFPIIHDQQSLKDFLLGHTDNLVFFNSQNSTQELAVRSNEFSTILIGPEGGFSNEEISLISKYSKMQEIHLSTPILRAPTAVAAAAGYLLAKYR